MPRFSGWRCDGPRCSSVAETDQPPPGWINVTVTLKEGEEVGRTGGANSFILCSNRCMARLGRERHQAAL